MIINDKTLYLAASNKNLNLVKRLIVKGADINAALKIACSTENAAAIEILISQETKVPPELLNNIVMNGKYTTVNMVLKVAHNLDINEQDGDGCAPIFSALKPEIDNSKLINLLLDNGANLDFAFYSAIKHNLNNLEMYFEKFLKHGGDINKLLHYALKDGNPYILQDLLNKGARYQAALKISKQEDNNLTSQLLFVLKQLRGNKIERFCEENKDIFMSALPSNMVEFINFIKKTDNPEIVAQTFFSSSPSNFIRLINNYNELTSASEYISPEQFHRLNLAIDKFVKQFLNEYEKKQPSLIGGLRIFKNSFITELRNRPGTWDKFYSIKDKVQSQDMLAMEIYTNLMVDGIFQQDSLNLNKKN